MLQTYWIHGSWSFLWQALTFDAFHPPLDYVLGRLLEPLGPSDPIRKLLPVLWGTAGIAAFGRLLARRAGETAGLVGAALLAFSPYHVRYSQELRPYALGLLLLTASLLLLDRFPGASRAGASGRPLPRLARDRICPVSRGRRAGARGRGARRRGRLRGRSRAPPRGAALCRMEPRFRPGALARLSSLVAGAAHGHAPPADGGARAGHARAARARSGVLRVRARRPSSAGCRGVAVRGLAGRRILVRSRHPRPARFRGLGNRRSRPDRDPRTDASALRRLEAFPARGPRSDRPGGARAGRADRAPGGAARRRGPADRGSGPGRAEPARLLPGRARRLASARRIPAPRDRPDRSHLHREPVHAALHGVLRRRARLALGGHGRHPPESLRRQPRRRREPARLFMEAGHAGLARACRRARIPLAAPMGSQLSFGLVPDRRRGRGASARHAVAVAVRASPPTSPASPGTPR